jgi:hypothetical protein
MIQDNNNKKKEKSKKKMKCRANGGFMHKQKGKARKILGGGRDDTTPNNSMLAVPVAMNEPSFSE